jgi:hypothetical protein
VAIGESGLIREVAIGESGLLREVIVVFSESDLLREMAL